MYIGIVVVGFLLLYIYDFNSIRAQHPLLQKFFFLGSVMILSATVMLFLHQMKNVTICAESAFYLVFFVTFLTLLLYTLFFALPFDDTYQGKSCKICNTGVYALCRHPGVIWFFLMYVCMYGLLKSPVVLHFIIVANLLNFIYIILQDCIIFPRTFEGYDVYQAQTPFLIPNAKSIKRCFETLRG